MSLPDGQTTAVVIGLREVYEQLLKLTSQVAELRSEVQRVTDRVASTDHALAEHKTVDQQRLSDHEVRLRGLERRGWMLAGAATALGGAGGWVASVLTGG